MARDQLCNTYLPLLKRWAHGRLPAYVRDLAETDDMVQNALIKAKNKLDSFSSIREAVILRVELGYSYPEIAVAIECSSANAARMVVARSLYKLAENMR